ncbi:regulator of sigma D [Sesbania bispinosa]|nr:regulator of sigma D [Sesbania bispinosa]
MTVCAMGHAKAVCAMGHAKAVCALPCDILSQLFDETQHSRRNLWDSQCQFARLTVPPFQTAGRDATFTGVMRSETNMGNRKSNVQNLTCTVPS